MNKTRMSMPFEFCSIYIDGLYEIVRASQRSHTVTRLLAKQFFTLNILFSFSFLRAKKEAVVHT